MAETTKMFVHVKKGSTLNLTDLAVNGKYYNSIVFDENTGAIFARGGKYGSVEEALAALKYFSSVAGNSGTAEPTASKTGSVLNIKGDGTYVTTSVGESGVTITGKNWTSEIADAKAAGTAATAALEEYQETNDAAVEAAKDQADKGVADAAAALAEAQKKVASVKSGSLGVEIKGTATDPTVALKLDNSGNVKFTEGDNGLKAEVTIEEVEVPITNVSSGSKAIDVTVTSKDAKVSLKTDNTGNVQFTQTDTGLKGEVSFPVTGVKSGDKVLGLNGTELTSTIRVIEDSAGKKIKIVGKTDTDVLGEFSYADWIVDGMLEDVQYDPDTHKISFTFNTDAGSKTIEDIDLSGLIDTYEAGLGIKFTTPTAGTGTGKKIEVEVDSTNDEGFLDVTATGLKTVGIKNAIATAKGEAITAAQALKVNGKAFGTTGEATVTGADIALTGYEGEGTVEATDTVNSAIAKLESAIESAAEAGVTSVDGITGAVTTDTATDTTTVGHVKFSKSGQKITAVAENVASAAQGAKADTALQSVTVTEGTYVKVTKGGTDTTPTFTVNDSAIESLFAWEEL